MERYARFCCVQDVRVKLARQVPAVGLDCQYAVIWLKSPFLASLRGLEGLLPLGAS
jgi:hypothetical protein